MRKTGERVTKRLDNQAWCLVRDTSRYVGRLSSRAAPRFYLPYDGKQTQLEGPIPIQSHFGGVWPVGTNTC